MECLKELRARGVRCLAAHPRADGKTLSQADFSGDCCIVFGSEGNGITAPVLEACDAAVAIPMPPTVDSLERRRRRGGFPLRSQPAARAFLKLWTKILAGLKITPVLKPILQKT